MTLDSAGLKSGIEAIGNKTTIAAAAAAWASAVGSYATGLIPKSGAVAGAQTALEAALVTAFAERPSAATKMDDAFAAFAVAVAGGMTTHTGAPPTGKVGFAAVFSPNDSASDAAEDIADAIHAWMITGKATMKASPFTISNWS